MKTQNAKSFMDIKDANCLEPYAVLATVMHPTYIEELLEYNDQVKGFLCHMQVPLLFVIAATHHGKMAEIGCWYGRATRMIKLANPSLDLICIDTFEGSEEHQNELQGYNFQTDFENNIKELKKIQIISATSEEASKQFDNESFDIIWIDGAHDYHNVKLDIECWYPKLKPNCLLLGHDYPPDPSDTTGGFEELIRAVDENVKFSKKFYDFGSWSGVWAARKERFI